MPTRLIVDANEAVARIAYAMSDVIAIYPITPASPMGEYADAWRASRRWNLFEAIPEVIEMQSEGGAAGVVHGALQGGVLSTTFTASQGLLLMIPNMYKIAGELTPAVFHVAARTLATHALSIFGDHSDVMACRGTGWAMLCSSSVQEAQDFAAISHIATLSSRVPFLHFFDGFRTSHELNCIEELPWDDLRALLDFEAIERHRQHGLNPDTPVLRGTAQNPDVFFQAREAINPYYDQLAGNVQSTMDAFGRQTGRSYRLFEYFGAPDADRVIVLMGSGVGAVEESVEVLRARGERVGGIKVRLARPFSIDALVSALPTTVRSIAVLDRNKDPGSLGEPLFLDVLSAIHIAKSRPEFAGHSGLHARVVGGRYGLASKEFTPAMASAIFKNLEQDQPKHGFTVGIVDDVTHLSLPNDETCTVDHKDMLQAMFFGLGSDGTVGANKNTVKIIAETTPQHAQGYFVYDSKKSGAMTISHVRIGPRPIRATYLIQQADFIGCHQFSFLEKVEVLEFAKDGATVLLNAPYGPGEVWAHLPVHVQRIVQDRNLRLYVIDAEAIARNAGLAGRINVIMQVCFFALTEILPIDDALREIRAAIEKTYGRRGSSVLDKNYAAVDAALAGLHPVSIPRDPVRSVAFVPPSSESSSFVDRVTRVLCAGKGDRLPVSAFPVDGTFPTGTAMVEKRGIASQIPYWDPDLCIQCGLCSLVCPHAAIRVKAFDEAHLNKAPETLRTTAWTGKDFPGHRLVLQVAPDDCTGCGVCVDVCPARSKEVVKHKAINMRVKAEVIEQERRHFAYFLTIPEVSRTHVAVDTVKGSQHLLPLFEFSGACAGCGETPYLKLVSQLFGDRMVVANATGCSSIYGGNLPTTPWTKNAHGQGPAWANSLFEDNAEFGLGIRLAWDHRERMARDAIRSLASLIPSELIDGLLGSEQHSESQFADQRARVAELKERLRSIDSEHARQALSLADALVRKSVWIIGGDGWAYDIGFGGLDHVLASGKNVNVLVLDTEVYSNTGGQASKSTPRGAVAKFASAGKGIPKKDIGMIAMAYGHVYVAQIALAAHPMQALRAITEAEAYPGPSLILAYSQCIAHGIDMTTGMTHQKDAVNSGYWPLYRFDPRVGHDGGKPFHLDSKKPNLPFQQFATKEARFSMLMRSDPQRAEQLMKWAQMDIDDRWHYYEQIANVERSMAGWMDEVHA